MSIISLFFPAVLSLGIYKKRGMIKENSRLLMVVLYVRSALVNNLLAMATVTYIFKIDGVEMSALNSFSFFVKYTILAIMISVIIPYVEEMISKFVKIEFSVKGKDDFT